MLLEPNSKKKKCEKFDFVRLVLLAVTASKKNTISLMLDEL